MAIGFTTRAKIDLGGVTKKVSPSNVLKGRRALANQILLDTTDFVPKRSGDLRASASIGLQGETITWNTVYARAQFYGTNGIVTFKKYTTPGTGRNWYKKARNKNIDGWKETVLKEMGL